MSFPFLCGLLSAWSFALVAVGVFFCLAFALGRREAEYLLFGVLALTFAGATSGIALKYGSDAVAVWHTGSAIAHASAALGLAVQLHFVLRYTGSPVVRPVAIAYALAGVFFAVRLSGWWWIPGSEQSQVSELLGYRVVHLTAQPLPHAIAFYAFALSALVVSAWVLCRAFRRGQREALPALVGGGLLLAAGLNDICLATGVNVATVYLLPHGFLLYSFGVAATLIYRYRRAVGDLEQTAANLRQRTVELRESHDELSLMEGELVEQQQLATVGELAASIAHEVRNPLAIIVNATASLRRPVLRDQDRDVLLSIVDEEASRLNGLVTDLLRFARPLRASRSSVDLRQIADRAEQVAGDRCRVHVSVPQDTALRKVSADPDLLWLAMDNLVENACLAMPRGGTIRIASRADSLEGLPCVRLEVADEGSGMTPDVKQRAFDPFFATRSRGTGLGLPIVRRIMDAHRGAVVLESEPGRGTTVALLFPSSDSIGYDDGAAELHPPFSRDPSGA